MVEIADFEYIKNNPEAKMQYHRVKQWGRDWNNAVQVWKRFKQQNKRLNPTAQEVIESC